MRSIQHDGSWFAKIEGFEVVWGNGLTVEDYCQDLLEVLEEWIILKLEDGDPLPVMDGIEIIMIYDTTKKYQSGVF